VPCVRPRQDDSVHQFQERGIVRATSNSDLGNVSVRERKSLGHNTDGARHMIVPCNMKESISPNNPPANLLDCACEAFGIAVKDSEGFAVLTLLSQEGMKGRESGILTQLTEFHFVE